MIGQNSKENFEARFATGRDNQGLLRTADKAFCLICGKQVDLADYAQAAEYFKTDLKDVEQLAESRQLHRIHNQSGATMICEESLFSLLQRRPTQPLKRDFLPFDPANFKTSEDI